MYDANRIYEELKDLIEFYRTSKKSEHEKNTAKKKSVKKDTDEEVKEMSEKGELNFNDKEIFFLLNLWLLLILTNPQIDRRFEFLREFLFVSNDLPKKTNP